MNANRVAGIVGVVIWLTMLQTALAFYNPNTGRWLNRDPIDERGFKLSFNATTGKVETCNDYLFVRNEPLLSCDAYGLSVADVANMYLAFVNELEQMCACHLTCPELGSWQNIGAYWGCTRQTEHLQTVFDNINYEDMWDITVNFDTSLKPRNPEDPVVDADTWKGCFSVTWPKGSSQQDFKRCFTCKELLKKDKKKKKQ